MQWDLNFRQRLSFQVCLSFVIRRPIWVLAALALVTILLAGFLPRLSFKTTVYDLIIADLPEARRYEEFRDQFGSDEIIQVVIRAKDIFDSATFAKVRRISDAAGQTAGVLRVISLPEVKKSVDRGNTWEMEKFAAMLAPVGLFQRNLISPDRQSTVISVVLGAGADRATVIAALREIWEAEGSDLHFFQTGIPMVSDALARYIRQDVLHLTPFALLVIALLLVVLFRNPHCVLLPLACVLLAMIWTFGLMALSGVALSMLTIIVPVFLIAVGTAYCMHLCTEYLDQAERTPAVPVAIHLTLSRMALPVFLAVLTTIIGVGSLVINRIAAIQEFAIFAAFGMFSLLLIVLTFFPAMLALLPLPRRRVKDHSALDRLFNAFLDRIIYLNQLRRKPVLTVMGIVAAICLTGVLLIRVETNPISFFKENTDVRRDFNDIYRSMAGCFPINVVMAGPAKDYFENPSNVAEILRLQRFLDQLPGVDKTISFADYLMLVNYAYNRYDAQFYTLPEDESELRLLMNTFKILLGNDLLQRFMSSDYSRVNILMLTHVSSSSGFLETRRLILEHVQSEFDEKLSWEVTGLGMVIAASSDLLTKGQVKSLALSLALIFAVMTALFLSGKVGLIAVVPNLFPIVVNFGMMGFLGIPLSMATSLIASVAIGLAVDDTIHYLARYNHEFKKDLDKDRAMRDTLLSVGRPMVYTSCTIGLGFSILIFSHFQPTAIFGLLMVITMVSALAGDILLLPILMLRAELVTAWDLLKIMPTLGRISPAMVHELNQPLNAIKVGSDFLNLMLRQNAPIQEKHLAAVAREIGEQVARASRMIQQLSEVQDQPGFDKQALQINGPVRATLALMENQFKLEGISLRLDLDEDLPPILGHHNRLMQVMYNLLENAREAIVARRAAEEAEIVHEISIRTFAEGERVYVAVSDTGHGIADYHKDRIFEPFFTTRAPGQGRGLGLTTSLQIVRDCGGRINVDSRVGEGTTITVSLPATRQIESTLRAPILP